MHILAYDIVQIHQTANRQPVGEEKSVFTVKLSKE